MPALDDYEAPAPLWLVICALLERDRELSLTKLHRAALKAGHGMWFASYNNVRSMCRKMRAQGILKMRIEARKRNPSQIHSLTPLGHEMFLEGRELALALLDTTKKRKDGK